MNSSIDPRKAQAKVSPFPKLIKTSDGYILLSCTDASKGILVHTIHGGRSGHPTGTPMVAEKGDTHSDYAGPVTLQNDKPVQGKVPFPKLMISSKSGVIVLATSQHAGLLVHATNRNSLVLGDVTELTVGELRPINRPQNFLDYPGAVTLTTDEAGKLQSIIDPTVQGTPLPKPKPFPKLMAADNEDGNGRMVVLFVNECVGVVVEDTDPTEDALEIGYFTKGWAMDGFTDYAGPVTIQNS